MEQNKEKIRHILQYYYDKGKNSSHAPNKICPVYGPDIVSISTAQRWFQRFRSGAEVIEDAPRSERLVIENCDEIAELIERDRHSSSRSIGQELGMSHQTVINHLKKIGFKKKLDATRLDAKKHFCPYRCMRIASESLQNRPIFEADGDWR